MAKYVKANEVKAGKTLYLVHPKFDAIEKCFVKTKPRKYRGHVSGDIFNYNIEYLSVDFNTWVVKKDGCSWNPSYEQLRFLSDSGIPNKNGEFSYVQQRRAFRTMKAALKYLKDNRTEENIAKWEEEDEIWESLDFIY